MQEIAARFIHPACTGCTGRGLIFTTIVSS
jgi:hypothetical protein